VSDGVETYYRSTTEKVNQSNLYNGRSTSRKGGENVKERMKELFETDVKSDDIIVQLQEEFEMTHAATLEIWYQEFTPAERRDRQKRILRTKNMREKNPSWVGGRHIDANGYSRILKPDWYEGGQSDYALEHVIIYCQAHHLTRIPEGHVVHHRDFNKLNNHPSNLKLLTDYEHGKIHNAASVKV